MNRHYDLDEIRRQAREDSPRLRVAAGLPPRVCRDNPDEFARVIEVLREGFAGLRAKAAEGQAA